MEAVAACLLNATNATNATVVPEELSDMYELLQRQCRIAPGLEFKNAYGTVQAMLFIALAVPTVCSPLRNNRSESRVRPSSARPRS